MTERPIIFSAPMVNAILDGRKTMTRRIVKPNAAKIVEQVIDANGKFVWDTLDYDLRGLIPYGQPGDRLWVRETWQAIHVSEDGDGIVDDWWHAKQIPKDNEDRFWGVSYCATEPEEHRDDGGFPWRPAIHMPRWASRINLEIESVRVERLQAITEEDAKAEGAEKMALDDLGNTWKTYKRGFQSIWESINGRESWDLNPWVWAIGFKVVPK